MKDYKSLDKVLHFLIAANIFVLTFFLAAIVVNAEITSGLLAMVVALVPAILVTKLVAPYLPYAAK